MNYFYVKENLKLDESITKDFKDKFGEDLFNEFQSIKNRVMQDRVKELILRQGIEEGQWNDISYWIPKDEMELADFIDIAKMAIELKDRERENRVNSIDELSKFTYLDDHEGADLIYNDEQYEVYKINTPRASQHLGSNTKWCISGTHIYTDRNGLQKSSEEYFEDYIGIAKIYFYMDKIHHHKYATIQPYNADFRQVFSDDNKTVNEIPNEPEIRGISNVTIMRVEVVYEDDVWLVEKVLNTRMRGNISCTNKLVEDDSVAFFVSKKQFIDPNNNSFSCREFARLGENERNLLINYFIPAGIVGERDI